MNYKAKEDKTFFVKLFFIIIALTGAFALLKALLTDGATNKFFAFPDTNDALMDFFHSVYDSSFKNPYKSRGVIYPPLTYLFYSVFARALPTEIINAGGMAIRTYSHAITYYMLFFSLQIITLAYQIGILSSLDKPCRNLLCISVIFSAPMFFCMERGNLILLTLICLLEFFILKDDPSPKKRELALICLAIAANIKIYPAVFGLLLLTEKKYKSAIRCAFYGVILFIVPFFFTGGLSSIRLLIENIANTGNNFALSYGQKVDVANLFGYFHFKTDWMLFELLGKFGNILMFLCLIFVLITVKKSWQRATCLSLACILVPTFSWMYSLIYLIIPLLLFFKEEKKINKINSIFFLLFSACFIYYPINILEIFPFLKTGLNSIPNLQYEVTLWNLSASAVMVIMTLLLVLCGIKNLRKKAPLV